ncbi:MAG: FAD-binding protein [Anaerohalosphaera sp.]|nr:FAD-binding protein [Anaerohalosphaera sp.]
MYDVAIIGAGPAGSTLARLIGEKYKTVIIDKRCFRNIPEGYGSGKCCGGLLAPDAQAMLAKLGLALPREVHSEPQLFVVRVIDIQRNLERYYQRYYINMDRWQFDRWLLSLAPASVDIIEKTRLKTFEKNSDHFDLSLKSNAGTRKIKAKLVIGADGGFSRVRKLAFNTKPFPKKYISIQHWVEMEDDQPFFSSIFDSDVTDYYSWTIPKRNALIIGTAVTPGADAYDKFNLLKSRLKQHGYRFGETLHTEGAYILRPVRQKQICTGKDSIALIGEAAGFISPSSAEGFSYAFKSASLLAKALRPGLKGFEKRYRTYAGPLKTNIAMKNIKSRILYNPFLRGMIMRTGINSMNINFRTDPATSLAFNNY